MAHEDAAFVEGGEEWFAMWSGLQKHDGRLRGNPTGQGGMTGAENDLNGERWQYMGSARKESGWVHEFRHRDHPVTGRREYAHVPATAGWMPG